MKEINLLLEKVLSPLCLDQWNTALHEKTPFHLPTTSSHKFDFLTSLKDLDRLLRARTIRGDAVEIAKNGEKINIESFFVTTSRNIKYVESSILQKAFVDGHTLILHAIDNYILNIYNLCSELEFMYGCKTQANAYITPSKCIGFPPHFDSHDVLVLQISGSKKWNIWHERIDSTDNPQLGSEFFSYNFRELILEPGGVLYIPRGFIHKAQAMSNDSFHITIGLIFRNNSELISQIVRESMFSDEWMKNDVIVSILDQHQLKEEFKKKLMYGMSRILRKNHISNSAVANIAKRSIVNSRSITETIFNSENNDLTLSSSLKRKKLIPIYTERKGNFFNLYINKRRVAFPIYLENAISYVIKEKRVFQPRNIPGNISEAKKIAISQRLISENLLERITKGDR